MRQHSPSIGILAIACGLLINASVAKAAIDTWVSGTGSDAGNCPITAPCRTFAFAHTQTNNNGTINVLSSGNFGPLTITKPISIVAQGVEALINTGASGAGIIVQTGPAQIVSLRGLTIDLRGTNNTGILFDSGAALHVHDSVIRKAANGILFSPDSGNSELYVVDSVVANSSQSSILVVPGGSAGARIVIDRVRVENGALDAIFFRGDSTSGSIKATLRDSVSAGNGGAGIRVNETGGGTTDVMIDRSASVNNGGQGIITIGAGATVRMGDSTVTGNATGLAAISGSLIASYGTNKIDDNTSAGSTPTPIAMK